MLKNIFNQSVVKFYKPIVSSLYFAKTFTINQIHTVQSIPVNLCIVSFKVFLGEGMEG